MITVSGHTFDETALPESPRVLDIGSRNYGFALGVLGLRPVARITCVEPDPSAPAPPPGVSLRHAALVGNGRARALYASFSTGEGNYIIDSNIPFINPEGAVCAVPCVDIRDLYDAAYLETFDLVKLDCEGAEFGILEHWPRGGIAAQITVEFHDYRNPERWNALYWPWLWSQLPDYEVVQHEPSLSGAVSGHWDTLLRRRT